MKKTTMIGAFIGVLMILLLANVYAQDQNPAAQQQATGGQQQSDTVQQQGGWYCPWMGMRMQGGSGGWGCPRGGRGAGPHCRGQGRMAQYAPQPGKQLTQEQAKTLLQDYLQATGNPNLKLGKVVDKGGFYEAEIVTKEGSLADKIQVNKDNGWFRSAY